MNISDEVEDLPCFRRGEPTTDGKCQTNGHYMCNECSERATCFGCGNRPADCECLHCEVCSWQVWQCKCETRAFPTHIFAERMRQKRLPGVKARVDPGPSIVIDDQPVKFAKFNSDIKQWLEDVMKKELIETTGPTPPVVIPVTLQLRQPIEMIQITFEQIPIKKDE